MIEGIDYTLRKFRGDHYFSEVHVYCPACSALPGQPCQTVSRDKYPSRRKRNHHQARSTRRDYVRDWVITETTLLITTGESLPMAIENTASWKRFIRSISGGFKETPGSYAFQQVVQRAQFGNLHMIGVLFQWLDYRAKEKLKGVLA